MRSWLVGAALAAGALSAPAFAVSPELVVNGGFETGDFTGFTLTCGGSCQEGVTTGSGFVHTGNFGAALGSVGADTVLTQNIATVAGQKYDVSFWFSQNDGPTNDFNVSFAGQTLISLVNYAPDNLGFEQYSYQVTATGASSALVIGARQDPGYQGLDDISVTAASGTVPEPATWALMIGGFGLVGATLRRRTAALAA